MRIRHLLGRSATVRKVYHWSRSTLLRGRDRILRDVGIEDVPPEVACRLLYQVLLAREPDPHGFADNLSRLVSGEVSRTELAAWIRGNEEFQNLGWPASAFGPSIHAGRCQFIHSLPAARRIVDLGGTHLSRAEGALVALGYPYAFDELTIIDLPADDRHEIYRRLPWPETVMTGKGPVTYRYHSMTDLSDFGDESVDLVYSGQSIEHVSPDDAKLVLSEVFRILRPGGYLGVDTPNARVTRMQQPELIDPDHKVEYTWPELREAITSMGFEVTSAAGLNYGGPPVHDGRFDIGEVAHRWGMHHALEDCYILAVVAQKPASG